MFDFNFNTADRVDDNGDPIPGTAARLRVFPPATEPPDVAMLRAMAEHGLNPGTLVPGGLERFDVEKTGDKAGWYRYYDDGIPAGAFGNWKTGFYQKWCSKQRHEVDPEAWAEHERRMAEMKKEREAEEAKRHAKAKTKAEKIWHEAQAAPADHPYLVKKGVPCHGLRITDDKTMGRVVLVPAMDNNGEVHTLQRIGADGEKRFLSGGAIQGNYFTIHGEGQQAYLCEGYATGATVHAATGATVYVGFNAGNLPKVAKVLKQKFPTDRIVVAADDDQHREGNPGRKHGEEASLILGTKAIFPTFSKWEGGETSDFNDLCRVEGLDMVKAQLEAIRQGVPSRQDLTITTPEWYSSRLSPVCIVKHFLYSDIAVLAAPGGTGKTTIALFEAIHIVLEKKLYGLEVAKRGWCLFITSEDSRELLIARLRKIVEAMGLTDGEVDKVKKSILFWDVSGEFLKLISLSDGNIVLEPFCDDIVNAYKVDPPVLVTFDPAVSFGVGESRVNDNEQGLITAGRRIRNGLNCVVRFIHHTGQAAAREKIMDQYAARGGTALVDGSRMCFIMQPWGPKDSDKPPASCTPTPDASIVTLSRAKLSYAPPNLPLIWIKRTGWNIEYFIEDISSEDERFEDRLNQIEGIIIDEEANGHFPTKGAVEGLGKKAGLSRQHVRLSIEQLISECRVIWKDLPGDQKRGAKKQFLGAV